MPEVTERILERGLNKRTGESEGSNEGYGERFFNRSIGSRVRVWNRAEKIKFDRISGSSLMPLLPLLLCVNRTLHYKGVGGCEAGRSFAAGAIGGSVGRGEGKCASIFIWLLGARRRAGNLGY